MAQAFAFVLIVILNGAAIAGCVIAVRRYASGFISGGFIGIGVELVRILLAVGVTELLRAEGTDTLAWLANFRFGAIPFVVAIGVFTGMDAKATRPLRQKTPAETGLPFRFVRVTFADGLPPDARDHAIYNLACAGALTEEGPGSTLVLTLPHDDQDIAVMALLEQQQAGGHLQYQSLNRRPPEKAPREVPVEDEVEAPAPRT